MNIFKKNKARGHKFLPNIFIFGELMLYGQIDNTLTIALGFCMSRIMTCILRIVSVANPRNVQLAIAAQIFVAVGVLILFLINLVFTMRLVRSLHSSVGWHPVFSVAFKILCVLVGSTIILVISSTVQSFYTLDTGIKATDKSLQLYASTFLAVVATLPLPIVISSLLIPYSPPDQFGVGSLRTKVIVLLVSSAFLSLGAWYRCGSSFQPSVPRNQPLPGYLGKAPFYFFNFFVEIQTVFFYAIMRVDLRFHIPNGAKGPGSYSQPQPNGGAESTDSGPNSSNPNGNNRTSSDSDSIAELTSDPEKAESLYFRPELNTRQKTRSTASQNTAQIMRFFAKNSIEQTTFKFTVTPPPGTPTTPTIPTTPSTSTTPSTPTTPTSLTSEMERARRESEQERTMKRLGGPWEKLPSPTISRFSEDTVPPSIPDTIHNGGDWTPSISWDMSSPLSTLR